MQRMNAFKAKDILSTYNGKNHICDLFWRKENLSKTAINILWDHYLEFMTIKVLAFDTGVKNQMKYSTSQIMESLWNAHVQCTERYQQFMLLVNKINPMVDFIHHSLEMSISSETSKKKRRYNTAIAYRKLFNKECNWIYDETEPNPPIPIKESRKRKQNSVGDEYSKIYVKSLNGNKTHTIRIVSCMTVKQLKQLIKTLDGTSVERQHLILAGKELQDQCLLGHYCMRSGCTMHLVCSKTSRMLQKVNLRRSP